MNFIKGLFGYESAHAPQGWNYVCIDTEATTAKPNIYAYPAQVPEALSEAVRAMCAAAKVKNPNMQEMISFGACLLNGNGVEYFFKPVVNPKLDPFTTELTGITQEQVDAAQTFNDGYFGFNVGLFDGLDVDVDDSRNLMVACGSFDLKFVLAPAFLNTGRTPAVFFQRVCNIKVPFQTYLDATPSAAERHQAWLNARHDELVNAFRVANPNATAEQLADARAKAIKQVRLDCDSMLYTFDLKRVQPAHSALADARSVALIAEKLIGAGIALEPTDWLDGYSAKM